ncbi:hypothetical protein ACN4EK_15275 [Pantanalinema rosaneae CENA516]
MLNTGTGQTTDRLPPDRINTNRTEQNFPMVWLFSYDKFVKQWQMNRI